VELPEEQAKRESVRAVSAQRRSDMGVSAPQYLTNSAARGAEIEGGA
jgi:hypothetical protein